MNLLSVLPQRATEFLTDPDVEKQVGDLEIKVLGGRPIGIINNQFIDLMSAIAGPGAVLINGEPTDIRRENLCRLSYGLGTGGELAYVPIQAGDCHLALSDHSPRKPASPASYENEAVRINRESPYGYLPLGHTAHVPNVSLDSIDNASTLLTLSHWPSNKTPAPYKANLSTQSVFSFLKQRDNVEGAKIVTSDHFDLDGLASIYAFLSPSHAMRHQQLLIDIARLGDFSRGVSAQALKAAFAFNSLAAQVKLPGTIDTDTALLHRYRAVLPMVEQVLDHTERYEPCYLEGMDHLARSERLLSHPDMMLVEYPEIDLAVFHLPTEISHAPLNHRRPYLGLSNIAFHNRTRCGVVAIVHGAVLEVRQRYESWVERISGIARARRDLSIFARALQQDEKEEGVWRYGGVENIMPALKYEGSGSSGYSMETLLVELRQFLKVAPVAWRGSHSAK
ncbi:hypothetical protein HX871_28290 [Pseudomonas reactans]|uniref:Uncharacterized protein n=1 Tax=Pseudomonas reactans TaxID=117680 RepID=A0ABX2R5I9_9PSED|nr:DUF6687 family protein [Pseudomonas reactans]NWA43640.1 hypothetical protein [Pseudomonas reactans]NWC88229.1 hypothetical protein [Pseudomonas reactans]NWD30108.1 hypothetical protein [Pseudomonas reactans]NWD98329.1 hypothetical protein [Pseudomonas reactans]